MKVYDKEIYQKQQSITTTIIIIVVFLLGFFAGYVANSFSSTPENEVNNVDSITNIDNTSEGVWFNC